MPWKSECTIDYKEHSTGFRRAQVSLYGGGGAGGARPTTALYPVVAGRETRDTGGLGLGTFTVKSPGRCLGTGRGWPCGSGRHPEGRLSLMAFVVWGVQSRCQEAWEAVPKLMETCLRFRFRNFPDLWASRVGWDSRKAGQRELAVRRLGPLTVQESVLSPRASSALPPWTPRVCWSISGSRPRPWRPLFCAMLCGPQQRSCSGSGGKQDSRKGNLI